MLYNANLTNLNNMTGDQIGAYFGYSVASGDLNGDGLDDVIVGAPMWTNYEVMGKYETGRVYVVYQDSNVRAVEIKNSIKSENFSPIFSMPLRSSILWRARITKRDLVWLWPVLATLTWMAELKKTPKEYRTW